MRHNEALEYERPDVSDYGDLVEVTGNEAWHPGLVGSPVHHPPSHSDHPTFSG